MAIGSGDFSLIVFKTAIKDDMGEMPLDGQMLTLLMALAGKSSAGMIAQKVGMSMTTVSRIISKLMNNNFIKIAEQKQPVLGKEFFDFLINQLSVIAGPIAELLVEDATKEIGQGSSGIPKMRAAELVDLLARQIPEEKQR